MICLVNDKTNCMMDLALSYVIFHRVSWHVPWFNEKGKRTRSMEEISIVPR